MQSFLVISPDTTKREEYLNDFIADHSISKFDIVVFAPEKASIGIEDVRNLQKSLYVKPYQGEYKLLAIKSADLLTVEAQNALLKVLEEPPVFVLILLLAGTENAFLPTILSRCSLVILPSDQTLIPDTVRYTSILDILEKGSVGEKLALAETLAADKENLQGWFDGIILFLRERMLKKPEESREVVQVIEQLQEARKLFQTTNVNTRLLLEHTFLKIN